MSTSPHLDEAIALLRIARDRFHIDEKSGCLSRDRIMLDDLCAKPSGRNPGRPRSLSVFMFCNQDPTTLNKIAADLAKSEEFRNQPRGAACTIEAVRAIHHDGAEAFRIEEEPLPDHPGHVGITFNKQLRNAPDHVKRRFRDQLIDCFGLVRPLAELRRAACDA